MANPKDISFDELIDLIATKNMDEAGAALSSLGGPSQAATYLNQVINADIPQYPWTVAQGKEGFYGGPFADFRNPNPMGQTSAELFPLPPELRVPGTKLPPLQQYPSEILAELGAQEGEEAFLRKEIARALGKFKLSRRGEMELDRRDTRKREEKAEKGRIRAQDEALGKALYDIIKMGLPERILPAPTFPYGPVMGPGLAPYLKGPMNF